MYRVGIRSFYQVRIRTAGIPAIAASAFVSRRTEKSAELNAQLHRFDDDAVR